MMQSWIRSNMRKELALILILVFFIPLVISHSSIAEASPNIIVVPDSFPTIASAIENASNGDTILVKNGTYEENAIKTTKSLSIIGEGYQSTIVHLTSLSHEIVIDVLGHTATFYDPALDVRANNFKLSGLSINSNGGTIWITGNQTQISDNKITTIF